MTHTRAALLIYRQAEIQRADMAFVDPASFVPPSPPPPNVLSLIPASLASSFCQCNFTRGWCASRCDFSGR